MPDITRNSWELLGPSASGAVYTASYIAGVGSGSDRCLVVAVAGQSGKSIDSAFWNTTEAMTVIGPVDGPDRPVWLLFVLNPTSGVHDITITFSSAPDFTRWYALDLANVRQSAQPDDTGSGNNSSGATVLDASVTTTADKCWIVAVARENTGTTVTWAGVTELHTGAAMHFADSNGVVTPAGAETVTGTTGSTQMTAILSAAFAPADAAGPGGDVSWLPQVTVTSGPAFVTVPAGQIPPGS